MAVLELRDVETLVIANGNPAELILTANDWWSVYQLCRDVVRRDDKGIYVPIIATKVRPANNVTAVPTVDLSSKDVLTAVPDATVTAAPKTT